MKRLWAPWRMEYLKADGADECIFCIGNDPGEDRQRLILFRGTCSFVIMNRYPYANGHLMVAPYRHLGDPSALSRQESLEMHHLTVACLGALRACGAPDGFNLGMNVGAAAGAGMEHHIHQHIVPRWSGDTNFMPVLAEIRVVPEHLEATWRQLRKWFAEFSL